MGQISFNKIAKFEKVSFEQFREDWYDAFGKDLEKGINSVENNIKEYYESIGLPKRATKGSAGYDFYLPFSVNLKAGESIIIPTGIRCMMDGFWVLQCYPRSGHGFKYGIHMANTVGIIDSDYYYADNEGHIKIKLVNDSSLARDIGFSAGTAFCQGLFIPFGITIDDETDEVRTGGFGSTDSK